MADADAGPDGDVDPPWDADAVSDADDVVADADVPPLGPCGPGREGAVCRAAAGPCDLAETCGAGAAECPDDALAAAGTECRAASGIGCDAAELCDGVTAACPDDAPDACQVVYVLIPHPDDEYEAWSLIQASPETYTIFVLLTHGEATGACMAVGAPPCETGSGGPYLYQGPGSPVGQPDYGEWVEGAPWNGRWDPACDAARLASFHRFLDDMAVLDPSFPSAPAEVGAFDLPGTTTDGVPPQRVDGDDGSCGTTVPRTSSAARVFRDDRGARVVFDLGDGDLTAAEVIWALQAVRSNREAWGLAPELVEAGVVGAAFYNATAVGGDVAQYAECECYSHADHRAVHDALWTTNVGAGDQWGRTCHTDPDVANTGGRTELVDPAIHEATFRATATTREGPFPIDYGWLHATTYTGCETGCIFARQQSFWRR